MNTSSPIYDVLLLWNQTPNGFDIETRTIRCDYSYAYLGEYRKYMLARIQLLDPLHLPEAQAVAMRIQNEVRCILSEECDSATLQQLSEVVKHVVDPRN